MYYDFKEPVAKIAKHRVLAINRGEKEEFLQVKLSVPDEQIVSYLKAGTVKKPRAITAQYIERAAEDSYERLIFSSIEREVRNELTEKAEEQAMKVFASNLKNLLLQPPVKGRVVLGLDPAYRTGCKIAVVDDTGKVLVYNRYISHTSASKVEEAKKVLKHLIDKHKCRLDFDRNGSASKESEIIVADLIKEIDRKCLITWLSAKPELLSIRLRNWEQNNFRTLMLL
jgi:uncharacterized protein